MSIRFRSALTDEGPRWAGSSKRRVFQGGGGSTCVERIKSPQSFRDLGNRSAISPSLDIVIWIAVRTDAGAQVVGRVFGVEEVGGTAKPRHQRQGQGHVGIVTTAACGWLGPGGVFFFILRWEGGSTNGLQVPQVNCVDLDVK